MLLYQTVFLETPGSYAQGGAWIYWWNLSSQGIKYAHLNMKAVEPPGALSGGLKDSRLLIVRFFAALSEALKDLYATIRRGRNGQGS